MRNSSSSSRNIETALESLSIQEGDSILGMGTTKAVYSNIPEFITLEI